MKNLIKLIFPLFILAFAFNACVEEDFDRPPTEGTDPMLNVNFSIAELKAMHEFGSYETIEDDLIIKGVVVADDASGNLYRTFILQDETGGIEVLVDINDSYILYPQGREVYIKLQGLVLGDYNELIQLGGYIASDNSLGPVVEVTDHLIKSVKRGDPVPKVKTINELTVADVSTLIQINDVEFRDTSATYADAINQNAANVDLEDCFGGQVLVRTSGFANFANDRVASGNGTFIGVLSVYRDDFQFLIRDLSDLDMNGTRCDGGGGNPCDGSNPTIVSEIDEDFENGSNNDQVAINGWLNIATKGSRTWQFKEFDGNIYCQGTAFGDNEPEMETWLITPFIDLTEAKVLTFETAQAYWTHDALSVWVSTDFECDPLTAIWQPIDATLAKESDGSNTWVPSGDVDLSGLVGNQIVIGFKYVGSGPDELTSSYRIDNLKIGDGGGGVDPVDPCLGYTPVEVTDLDVDFQNGNNNDPVVINGWINVATKGDRNWIYKEFDGNVYTQATAFNDAAPETQSWLVTPVLDLTTDRILRFETAKAFWTHDALSVWTSTDFVCDPENATWEAFNVKLAGQADADHEWISTGDIDLSDFTGSKIVIGFRYEGNNGAGLTSSYRIDNMILE